jgi:hypothetical protein
MLWNGAAIVSHNGRLVPSQKDPSGGAEIRAGDVSDQVADLKVVGLVPTCQRWSGHDFGPDHGLTTTPTWRPGELVASKHRQ